MQDAMGTGSLDQAEMLGRLISRVASLEAAVAESQGVRRELHNQLVNLRGNVRPPNSFYLNRAMSCPSLEAQDGNKGHARLGIGYSFL